MVAHNLLVELFVEELAPKALKKLGEAFGNTLQQGLRALGLVVEPSAVNLFATPRRLAARISHVLAVAPDKPVSVKLMPVAVALDPAGQPTPALLKKLAGISIELTMCRSATVKAVAIGLIAKQIIISAATQQYIIAWAAVKRILPAAADQIVPAVTAVNRIVATATDEPVVLFVAVDDVIAALTINNINTAATTNDICTTAAKDIIRPI